MVVWGAVLAMAVAAIATAGSFAVPVAVAAPGLAGMAVSDEQRHLVPNRLVALTATAFTVAAVATAGLDAAGASLAGGAAAFAALVATLALDPRLGAGDVKLAAVTGAVAAWPWAADSVGALPAALVGVASLTAGLAGALAVGRMDRATPLAPSLSSIALLVAAVGLATRH